MTLYASGMREKTNDEVKELIKNMFENEYRSIPQAPQCKTSRQEETLSNFRKPKQTSLEQVGKTQEDMFKT